MKRTKRKITTLFMSLMLVLSLVAPMMPAMSMKVYAAAEEWNTDQNFETDVTVDGGVIIRRNITLTIAEGVMVTVNGGIDTNSTVTIKGKGHLIVNGSKGDDGVDLGYWESVDDPEKEAYDPGEDALPKNDSCGPLPAEFALDRCDRGDARGVKKAEDEERACFEHAEDGRDAAFSSEKNFQDRYDALFCHEAADK